MTNFERIKSIESPIEMCRFFTQLEDYAIYSNNRLISKENPKELFEWLNKETDDSDEYLFTKHIRCGRCNSDNVRVDLVDSTKYIICGDCHKYEVFDENNEDVSFICFGKRKYNSN